MYKSPIEIMLGEMQMQIEGEIFRAVQNYDIKVDKEELIRALRYDREQYNKGFRDAMEKYRWIPVTERLPDNYQKALCFTRYGDHQVFRWNYIDCMWNDGIEWYKEEDVLFWMPLPDLPEEEG